MHGWIKSPPSGNMDSLSCYLPFNFNLIFPLFDTLSLWLARFRRDLQFSVFPPHHTERGGMRRRRKNKLSSIKYAISNNGWECCVWQRRKGKQQKKSKETACFTFMYHVDTTVFTAPFVASVYCLCARVFLEFSSFSKLVGVFFWLFELVSPPNQTMTVKIEFQDVTKYLNNVRLFQNVLFVSVCRRLESRVWPFMFYWFSDVDSVISTCSHLFMHLYVKSIWHLIILQWENRKSWSKTSDYTCHEVSNSNSPSHNAFAFPFFPVLISHIRFSDCKWGKGEFMVRKNQHKKITAVRSSNSRRINNRIEPQH